MGREVIHKTGLLSFLIAITFISKSADRLPVSKPSIFIYTLANDSVSCIVPFNRVGNLIVLKARADTMEGNFILDTGAPGLVLNLTYFRGYPIAAQSDGEQASIAGSSNGIQKTTIKELLFGTLQYVRTEADLTNLGQIENAKGIKVLGLLGVELFKQYEMIIDFEKSLIYLHRIGRKEASTYKHQLLNDTSAYRTLPIDIKDNRIIMTTESEGKKLRLVIDCAAESNIIDSRLPNKFFENVTITRRVKLAGPGKKSIDAFYGSLSKLTIGGVDVNNLPVTITNLEYTCFALGGCVDGVLGFDFLSLHKIGFNFVNRKMYIWK
ncbi:MAG: retropepsin-like aspartic protease, partial [Flavisolibacter sp.]